jgi:hypothetical protein
MALPYNPYMNNPLPGAEPLTPNYPTTGGFLPQDMGTGGPLPMAGGMMPMATGTPQPMATGSTGYTLPNFGTLGSNPYAFSRPNSASYNTAIGTPQTQSFGYGGNQYGVTFGAGMTPAEITRLMTDYAGAGQQVFKPTDLLNQYYGYQNDLSRLQAEAAGGQAGAAARVDRFIDKKLPGYTVNFTPGTEGAVNPYSSPYQPRAGGPGGGGRGRGLLG